MKPPVAPDPRRPVPRLHVRVLLGPASVMGPGKADFLAAVDEVGSVVGAGRALGLSYKKARTLLNSLNATFSGPVVETITGGRTYGGARLTPLGAEVLACYRAVQRHAVEAVGADLAGLAALARAPELHPPGEGGIGAKPKPRRRAAGQRSNV